MTPVNEPSFYTTSELIPLLGFKNANAIYVARRNGQLPPGKKLGRDIKFPRYQIDAIRLGEDWRSAKPPLIDASAPAQAEAAQRSKGVSSAGVGGVAFLKMFIDQLADAVADRIESRRGKGERHEKQS